jgi:hypothetical protein
MLYPQFLLSHDHYIKPPAPHGENSPGNPAFEEHAHLVKRLAQDGFLLFEDMINGGINHESLSSKKWLKTEDSFSPPAR